MTLKKNDRENRPYSPETPRQNPALLTLNFKLLEACNSTRSTQAEEEEGAKANHRGGKLAARPADPGV